MYQPDPLAERFRQYPRTVAIVSWAIALISFVVAMLLKALILLNRAPGGQLPAVNLSYEPGFFLLATFGMLIIIRWPAQIIGWLFIASGAIACVTTSIATYEQFAGSERLPLLTTLLMVNNILQNVGLLILLAIAYETMQPTTVSIWIQNFERPQSASNNPCR